MDSPVRLTTVTSGILIRHLSISIWSVLRLVENKTKRKDVKPHVPLSDLLRRDGCIPVLLEHWSELRNQYVREHKTSKWTMWLTNFEFMRQENLATIGTHSMIRCPGCFGIVVFSLVIIMY